MQERETIYQTLEHTLLDDLLATLVHSGKKYVSYVLNGGERERDGESERARNKNKGYSHPSVF